MGMAASQCNFGALTRRKHDIGVNLERCSMEKTNLTREMRGVTLKYQNALNTKTLKWSNNSGMTYVDLSYANLMRPSNANQMKPYLITNANGNIVIDDKYKEYAEMISPDGKPGGDWESNRTKILASLIPDLSEEQINNSVAASNAADAAAQKFETLRNEADILYGKCKERACTKNFIAQCFGNITSVSNSAQQSSNSGTTSRIVNMPGMGFQVFYSNSSSNSSTTVNSSINIASDYADDEAQWTLGNSEETAKSQVKELLNQIKTNVSKYLTDKDLEAFNKAADKTCETYTNYVDSADEKNTEFPMSIDSKSKNYVIKVTEFINCLLNEYKNNGGTAEPSTENPSEFFYTYVNRDSESYKLYEAKQKELDEAKKELAAAVDNDNQSLTAEQESAIKFYDQLFSAIAEKGWNYNSQVNDNEYINNMLQNNQFFITTMEAKTDDEGKNYYEYEQSLASNFDNIVAVNDKTAQEDALVQYEYEKSIINEKETRVDTRMKNLETEQSSINKMLEGIKTERNDNIERTFSIEA